MPLHHLGSCKSLSNDYHTLTYQKQTKIGTKTKCQAQLSSLKNQI